MRNSPEFTAWYRAKYGSYKQIVAAAEAKKAAETKAAAESAK